MASWKQWGGACWAHVFRVRVKCDLTMWTTCVPKAALEDRWGMFACVWVLLRYSVCNVQQFHGHPQRKNRCVSLGVAVQEWTLCFDGTAVFTWDRSCPNVYSVPSYAFKRPGSLQLPNFREAEKNGLEAWGQGLTAPNYQVTSSGLRKYSAPLELCDLLPHCRLQTKKYILNFNWRISIKWDTITIVRWNEIPKIFTTVCFFVFSKKLKSGPCNIIHPLYCQCR